MYDVNKHSKVRRTNPLYEAWPICEREREKHGRGQASAFRTATGGYARIGAAGQVEVSPEKGFEY